MSVSECALTSSFLALTYWRPEAPRITFGSPRDVIAHAAHAVFTVKIRNWLASSSLSAISSGSARGGGSGAPLRAIAILP